MGWQPEQFGAHSLDEARGKGTTFVTENAPGTIAANAIEIVVNATGSPGAGIGHVLACCKHGKHAVMVNVEADALAGPLLAPRARQRLNCHLDTTDLLPAGTIKTLSIRAPTPEPAAMRQFVARQLATATMPGESVIFKRA